MIDAIYLRKSKFIGKDYSNTGTGNPADKFSETLEKLIF